MRTIIRSTTAGLLVGLFCFVLARAGETRAEPLRNGVQQVSLTVKDLVRESAFFSAVLGFSALAKSDLAGTPFAQLWGLPTMTAQEEQLRAGEQTISLRRFHTPGRMTPRNSRSNDGWFQHLAIVVNDIDRAVQALRAHHVESISRGGPQTIPPSNPAAGGIRAYYFRDPEGHPLELIWYPQGKGDPRWQTKTEALVLGIDHTAIAVRDEARSEAFYRVVAGLDVKGRSFNFGVEQEHLSGVPGARVRITGLRGEDGPGVEFLHYEAPTNGRPMPSDTRANDLWSSEITLRVPSVASALAAARRLDAGASISEAEIEGKPVACLRDPDGHAVRLVQ